MSGVVKTHRLNEFVEYRPDELEKIRAIIGPRHTLPAGQFIHRQGEPAKAVHFLEEGWAASCVVRPDGRQQITKVHLPGDLLGSPSICVTEAADSLIAVTKLSIASIGHDAFMALFQTSPRIATGMFLSAQRERVALMDMLTVVGRGQALSRLSAFLVDLYDRLCAAGMVEDETFHLPLTQERIADHLGLTTVHTNRSIQALRRSGLVEWKGHRIRILDVSGLRATGLVPKRRYVSNPPWLR